MKNESLWTMNGLRSGGPGIHRIVLRVMSLRRRGRVDHDMTLADTVKGILMGIP
ncbi:hypothetical protein LMG29739_04533 [Paraburkholderia solisilvae]|uniref:Uncharacterized protein n=1 Tax=Paraburkholderia solisilvae TaxID=624376 RepID=A0A6J5EFA8_9BURK|nr:hypothetical protein LMG29739_04533 [Paraburkholderia solisilvae]